MSHSDDKTSRRDIEDSEQKKCENYLNTRRL